MSALLALDVDGVLLDPTRGGRGPWQVAFGERFGVDARHLDGALFATGWRDVIVGKRTVESALAGALDALGWGMGVDAALDCWFEEDFVVAPEVLEAATTWAARGVPIALVSNQEPRRARYLEERLTPFLPFGGTAFSGDLGLTKSEPGFYERAERRLGIAERRPVVVFLDDTLHNVEVARRHGWTGIHFTVGADWRHQVDEALEGARRSGRHVDGAGRRAEGLIPGGPMNMSRQRSSPTISMSSRRRRAQASLPRRKRMVRAEPSRRWPRASPFSS